MNLVKPIFRAGPILSVGKLLQVLDITKNELETALSLTPNERYHEPKNKILKKDGSVRVIKNPCGIIRKIQKRINRRINKSCIRWPDYLFGSIPKNTETGIRDYVACASVHCGSRSLAKLDISSFFDNIHKDHVYKIFNQLFRYSDEVSEILADLCCYEEHLVQGALTSSYIASLILWDVEQDTVIKLRRMRLKYTRLVDDITISSDNINFEFSIAEKIVEDMLANKSLPLNSKKTKIFRLSTQPLIVHGLNISQSQPSYPKVEVDRIRATVHHLKMKSMEPNVINSFKYRVMYSRVMGKVNKLYRVKNDKRKKLLKILIDIKPKASLKDIEYSEKLIKWLNKNSLSNKTYFYYKKYNYFIHLKFFIKNCNNKKLKNEYNTMVAKYNVNNIGTTYEKYK